MHHSSSPEVLIVGAGPTGLALACELAKYEISFQIVDRKSGPSPESRAFGIHARTLEWLEQSGMAREFLDRGKKVTKAQIRLSEKDFYHLSFEEVSSKYPFMLLLPQQETEKILYKQLQAYGHEVRWGAKFMACRDESDKIYSMLEHPDGNFEEVKTEFLIGCDGARSTVRESSGLQFKGSTDQNYWLLADCTVEWESSKQKDQVYVFNTAEGVCAYFPLGEDWGRLMIEMKNQDIPAQAPDLQVIAQLVRNRKMPINGLKAPRWISYFRFEYRLAEKYRQNRVILVGDAAHIHSPVGALGLNTGIQDAANLGWKLAYYLKGKVNDEVLDSYELERRPVGNNVVKGVGMLTHLLQSEKPFSRFARRFLYTTIFDNSVLRNKALNLLTQIDLDYKNSYFTGDFWIDGASSNPKAKIRAGERIDDYELISIKEEEKLGLYELLRSPNFTLLVLSGDLHVKNNLEEIKELYREFYEPYSSWMNIHLILPEDLKVRKEKINFSAFEDVKNELHNQFGVKSSALILIRPDGYIAYRSCPIVIKKMKQYLQEQFILEARGRG
jgi:2-polyprenyl-6-methoxyphenol hydroxylase-like FAD-dependent oxidoreductase